MKLTALTCTYQRPEAFELCKRYMARQTRQPDQWIIKDGPEPMLEKVLAVLESGEIEGDALAFVEDDDFFSNSWLSWLCGKLERYELVGEGRALYYNVNQRWWSECNNRSHASLCQTAIRRSLFEILANVIRAHNCPWFDTQLWKIECNKSLHIPKDGERRLIGIKGMPGSRGYSREHWRQDPDGCIPDRNLDKLRELIGLDAESYATFFAPPEPLPEWKSNGKVECHILTYNEAEIIPFTLQHYSTFCSTIILHDGGSTDGTREIARRFGAIVTDWEVGAQLHDGAAADLKNNCWKGTDADWVICVDADELIYFPSGPKHTLEAYRTAKVPIVKTCGFEMFSEEYPKPGKQIYETVKMGAADDKWYGKPVLFCPHWVKELGVGMGAHECDATLVDGNSLLIRQKSPKPYPPAFCLHFHQIGPPERLAARYDAIRKRYSDFNEQRKLGNRTPGELHVQQKRTFILPNLVQVIP